MIVYFGCFNPPHLNHVNMICKARQMIRDLNAWGIFVPASDSYVNTKSYINFNLQQRIQILSSKLDFYLEKKSSIFTYLVDHKTTLSVLARTEKKNVRCFRFRYV